MWIAAARYCPRIQLVVVVVIELVVTFGVCFIYLMPLSYTITKVLFDWMMMSPWPCKSAVTIPAPMFRNRPLLG